MDKVGYIYKHTSPSGKSYIGKSLATKGKRWKDHIIAAYDAKYKEYDYPLQRAIRKYGEDSFETEILEDNIPVELLAETEVAYIEKYDTFYNGYNQTKGGEGTTGERSPEAKEAIAKANKERIWTEEMKDKIRESCSGAKGSKFVPWFMITPEGDRLEYYDKGKADVALENGWHVGSFKNMFSKNKKVGSVVENGKFKGYTFGNIGVEYGRE
jgi:group I intron endonuclease